MIVLIDNDRLVYLGWKLRAEKLGEQIIYFTKVDDFLNQASDIPKNTNIYVDSSLDDDIKGECESQKIWESGYLNIFLTTGYQADEFNLKEYPWIKKILGKEPPF